MGFGTESKPWDPKCHFSQNMMRAMASSNNRGSIRRAMVAAGFSTAAE